MSAADRRRLEEALHELRRPVQLLALVIESRLGDDPQARACLDSLAAALTLIEEAVSGRRRPARERFSAAELLADAEAKWGPIAGLRAARACPGSLEGDRDAIARALDNLIANAVVHGSAPIELEGNRSEGSISLEVHDGGPAPAAAAIGESGQGLGLGIATVVAAEHGGVLVGPDPGRGGTSAALRLPAAGGSP